MKKSELKVMANIEKFTESMTYSMLRHNARECISYANKDIDKSRTKLNYKLPGNHDGLSDIEYFKKVCDESYIYGRGTDREKDAIKSFGLTITLPKDIEGSFEKEKLFFNGVHQFLQERYGTVICSFIHKDEAGSLPHLQSIIIPTMKLDHDLVRYKTIKTKHAIKTESGQYLFEKKFKLDENGNKIPVKNYAKMTDLYDKKISAKDVVNQIELKHLHGDLQTYLSDHGIEGTVVKGGSNGINLSVKQLKEFTSKTGIKLDHTLTVDEVASILTSNIEKDKKIQLLNTALKDKNLDLETLKQQLLDKNIEIDILKNKPVEIQKDLAAESKIKNIEIENTKLKETVMQLQKELSIEKQKVNELSKNQTVEKEWGSSSGWGNKNIDKEIEKEW